MLSILNVYEGDVKITFDTKDAAEAIRAGRIITDMLRRGYALLIEVDGAYQRALDFDAKVGEYIIADLDLSYSPKAKREDEQDAQKSEEEIEAEIPPKIRSQRGRPRKGIPMESANAVAVAPTAGG